MTESMPAEPDAAEESLDDDGASAAASGHPKFPVTARTKARRRAVEVLFEADQRGLLQGDSGAQNLRELAAERAFHSANHTEAPAYTRQALAGVADHLTEIDETIETYSHGWVLSRMPATDRAIARLATWEIVWNDDVDAPVAVDEAITLARMLSTDDSPRFLNGLLGRISDLADTLR
ncbi:N utilization substance protein B homolog [Actinomyces succiniciruminis]|uniref:Transcription antitermination protein NusB n=2 Tax=Actinomyces succiniciruminis TaxID=1522002 RepID=A0A1L7RSW3_9ACTO|nr:N utilization substance protein B homolog [Actinomyces succiniciruminis]